MKIVREGNPSGAKPPFMMRLSRGVILFVGPRGGRSLFDPQAQMSKLRQAIHLHHGLGYTMNCLSGLAGRPGGALRSALLRGAPWAVDLIAEFLHWDPNLVWPRELVGRKAAPRHGCKQ